MATKEKIDAMVVEAKRSKAPDRELRSKVTCSILGYACIFSTLDWEKINRSPSVRVIEIYIHNSTSTVILLKSG